MAMSQVDLLTVFRARLESSMLYPAPGIFRMEKHHGPVHSIDCSPFHRQGRRLRWMTIELEMKWNF